MIFTRWKLLAGMATFLLFAGYASGVLAQTAETHKVQPVVIVGSQTTAQPQQSAPATADQKSDTQQDSLPAPEILIGAGDLLEVRVFGVQDLTQEVRVSSGGDITVPLVGTVHVADLSQQQAEDLLAIKFREGGFLKDPHVSVFTKEYATQGVSVLGEVTKPGVYPLLGARRLFDVISMAGGLTDKAGKLVTIAHRDNPDNIVVELSKDPAKTNSGNLAVAPGDTVMVSKAGIVYVVGDVSRPAGFIMDNNERLTVLQAIALAGGTNATASLDSSKIIRRTPNGIQEIPMSLKKILGAKADDVPLEPEDVLFVPRSAAKGAARRSAEAILQVTTGIAIYRR